MVRIEFLFPEFCNLFADSSNIKYLMQCLPEAELINTAFTDQPLFAADTPDLIYMGAMTEKKQEMVIAKLLPYKERLQALIEAGVPMLFTNNALEILGEYIETDEGRKIPALGIYPFHAKQDMMHRFNCLLRGQFKGMEILGFKTQFTMAYGDTDRYPFISVDKGCGMNKETMNEGIHDHNLFATYLVGPFLINNPDFTLYLMREVMGIKEAALAYEPVIYAAYERRKKEFHDPKTQY